MKTTTNPEEKDPEDMKNQLATLMEENSMWREMANLKQEEFYRLQMINQLQLINQSLQKLTEQKN